MTELELELDPRLMEVGQGEWEGRTHADLAIEDATRYEAWRQATWDRQPPGGEPVDVAVAADLGPPSTRRFSRTDRGSAWPLCITAHGGTLRLAAHALLEIPVERAWRLEFDNAALSLMDQVERPMAAGELERRLAPAGSHAGAHR